MPNQSLYNQAIKKQTGTARFKAPRFYQKKVLDFMLYRYRFLLNYILIGAGSIIIETIVALALYRYGRINVIPSSITGFIIGALFSYQLNSILNFRVPKDKYARTFRIFMLISAGSYSLSLLISVAIRHIYDFDYFYIRVLVASGVFILSYALHRRFTFVDIKYVGIALYLHKQEKTDKVWEKVHDYPDFIHIDLIDKTYNPNVVSSDIDTNVGQTIKARWFGIQTMTHVMSKFPSRWLGKIADFSDTIIVHFEIDENLGQIIQKIKSHGRKAGISILYTTDTRVLLPYLDKVDAIQVLGIAKPGHSGQSLQKEAPQKLAEINRLRGKHNFDICFDGGVKRENINSLKAKYIVSASSVLNANNPVNAIFDLKTDSRYYSTIASLKSFILKQALAIGEGLDFILSLNVVGSFAQKDDLDSVSDIDVVIIADKLNRPKFEIIMDQFDLLKDQIETDYSLKVKINDTFGPLKFNDEYNVVLHVMVYDFESHIEHRVKSPFTPLDWDRSEIACKAPLRELVGALQPQPNQLFNSRRSIESYISDLNKSVITYRKYVFNDSVSKPAEKVLTKKMTGKDQIEYSYHIMKYMILNFMKVYTRENVSYSEELIDQFFALTKIQDKYKKLLKSITKRKLTKKSRISDEDLSELNHFLFDLKDSFDKIFYNESTKLLVIRHAPTSMNKNGLFIGQKTDPSIKKGLEKEIEAVGKSLVNVDVIYSSPLKRAFETAFAINKSLKREMIVSYDLNEIDYGKVDGYDIDYLSKKFPRVLDAWQNKKDIAFPAGESYGDLAKRIDNFFAGISSKNGGQTIAIVTHNVVIRSIIGKALSIESYNWHKIPIEHLKPYELIMLPNGSLFGNFEPETLKKIYQSLYL